MFTFKHLAGAGLGLRYELWDDLLVCPSDTPIKFLELAPENWMEMGGRRAEILEHLAMRFPLVAHGLSLSLGGSAPLDTTLLRNIRSFLERYNIELYTEHLSYCADQSGHWYDLLPVPMTPNTAAYIADRIKCAQDILGRRIAIENASSYVVPELSSMHEWDFLMHVVELADCAIHLDINNIYVNSVNHGFNPVLFLSNITPSRVAYMHMAGHLEDQDVNQARFLIDTHGDSICNDVWELFECAVQKIGVVPTLVERDFNIPPLSELEQEVRKVSDIQQRIGSSSVYGLNRSPINEVYQPIEMHV